MQPREAQGFNRETQKQRVPGADAPLSPGWAASQAKSGRRGQASMQVLEERGGGFPGPVEGPRLQKVN